MSNSNEDEVFENTADAEEELTWDDEDFDEEDFDDYLINNEEEDFTSRSIDLLLTYISDSFPKEELLNSTLKKWFSGVILGLLIILTLSTVVIIILCGAGTLKIEEWTLKLFITGVFIEIVAIIRIIVNSLFPKDDRKVYLDFIKSLARFTDNNI